MKTLIEEYPHRPGGHCGSTAMRDLLKFYGHDYTEDMVFGLGTGIGFVYYYHPDMKPPVYIGGRIFNLEELLAANLGFELEMVGGLGPEEGWLAARELLDSGTPVIVHADVHYLDYLRAKVHFSGHRIVLVGYDEEKGVAFVADNDRDTIQECSLENLASARSSRYLPQPADNIYYLMRVPERLNPLEEAIPRALDKAVRFNLKLPEERAVFTYDGAEVARGVKGLEKFSSVMPDWPVMMDPESLSLLCKSIYVTAEKGGTGYGGNFRRMYGRFLCEASSHVSEPRLDELGKEFIATGDLWTKLSLTFKELSSDGGSAVREASGTASELYTRERGAFEALSEVANSLMRGVG